MSNEHETTRRETLKLAAAIAAFGAALGIRQTADGAVDMFLKLGRTEHKFDRLELKLYERSTLAHTCALPAPLTNALKRGSKVDMKLYGDGKLVELQ